MRICNNVYLQIRIIANTHYCDPDSSPLSTSNSELCLSTLNSHTENWVWDYFQSGVREILFKSVRIVTIPIVRQSEGNIHSYFFSQ